MDTASQNRFAGDIDVYFMKEQVYVHPGGNQKGISGYLSIIEQRENEKSEMYVTWSPNKLEQAPAGLDSSELYAIRVPLNDISNVKRYMPRFDFPYVLISLRSGVAFPPYFFHAGGVKEFLNQLEEHLIMTKSEEDANTFIVEDPSSALSRSISLDIPRISEELPSYSPSNSPSQTTTNHIKQTSQEDLNQYKSNKKEISFAVFEGFGKVTKLAKHAGKHLFQEEKTEYDSDGLETDIGSFEVLEDDFQIEASVQKIELNLKKIQDEKLDSYRAKKKSFNPLTKSEWNSYINSEESISKENEQKIREHIFYGGIEPPLRNEVWKYLLGFYEFSSKGAERQYLDFEMEKKYQTVKNQWLSISEEQESHWTKFRNVKHRIEKDVVRTDRTFPYYKGENNENLKTLNDILVTYAFWNFDIAYVQGMNDLLSVILFNVKEEAKSFWCFKVLMDRMGANFDKDQNGMHSQLTQLRNLLSFIDSDLYKFFESQDCLNMFFCFRWILIIFKREFKFDTIQKLWEVMWSGYKGQQFHLFIAIAILQNHKNEIMKDGMQFDDLLKYINDLSMNIDLESTLIQAELLYDNFKNTGFQNSPKE